jgi:biopolymer transport protein ExbD
MADIGDGGGSHKKGPGVKKSVKKNTKVDLTPMVDLGFLLITFFVFTTTMSTPTAMRLRLPKDTEKPEEQNKAKESGALTLLLGKDRTVYYYEGILSPDGSNFKNTNFGGLRQVLLDKKKNTKAEDLVIVIKPNDDSQMRDVVDALDEMTINGIKRYAMVDISPAEIMFVKATEGGGTPVAPPAAAPGK